MDEPKMNNRSANVELSRFIVSLLIMARHLHIFGLEKYPFESAWILTEFFIILTGYFVTKHYDGRIIENRFKDGVAYAFSSFIKLVPYTVCATILAYITNVIVDVANHNSTLVGSINKTISDFVFDVLLLRYDYPLIVPLWYVSALFVVLPLFAWIVQISNRYVILYGAFICMFMYHGYRGVNSDTLFPVSIYRMFFGLLLGALLYESVYILKDFVGRVNKLVLTLAEILCFLYLIASTYRNWDNYRLVIFVLYLWLFIMLTGYSYTKNIRGKLFLYLGKISMPIFIFHWYVGTTVKQIAISCSWSNMTTIVVYYVLTIVVSMLGVYIVDHWKWYKQIINKPIMFKD